MSMNAFRRIGLLVFMVAPLLIAVPASASQRASLESVTGRFRHGSVSQLVQDGACPDAPLDGDPGNPPVAEQHQLIGGQIFTPSYESLGVSVCWANSSALGGDYIDRGTFKIITNTGTLAGKIGGSIDYSHDIFSVSLTIVSGTGDLSGATGTLHLVGCSQNGGQAIAAKLRTTAVRSVPPACLAAG